MKAIILLLLFSSQLFSQTAHYKKLESGNFEKYISKSGRELNIGDTLLVKFPKLANTYTFITQGNLPCSTVLANTKNKITKIKVIGDKIKGYKTFMIFKGYGLLPVFIDYENALEIGEISQ